MIAGSFCLDSSCVGAELEQSSTTKDFLVVHLLQPIHQHLPLGHLALIVHHADIVNASIRWAIGEGDLGVAAADVAVVIKPK